MQQTIEKEAFVSNINPFELVAGNCLYYSPKTFDLTNRDFFESRLSQSDQQNEKTTVTQIPAVFRTL